MKPPTPLFSVFALLAMSWSLIAQRSPEATSPTRDVVQAVLVSPGSKPFRLSATITQGKEHSPYASIEMSWSAPEKYRRTIRSNDFTQTLIVNGSSRFEEDSADYFPLQLRTLVTAMVDPRPIIAAVRPGDKVATKANGAVNESGATCYGKNHTLCFQDKNGMRETVAASGHSVDFSRYENFHGSLVARELTNAPRLGEELMTLNVISLDDLKDADDSIFEVAASAASGPPIQFVTFSEEMLRDTALGPREIVWPQPLDGHQKGPASFYISIDRTGKVREVLQLYTVNERTNESARNQIMRWNFKPAMKDGLAAQVEGILTFDVDTRKWGPAEPLPDAEVRKLASGIVEPNWPDGVYPSGTVYTLWAAVDTDGHLIEVMAGDGPHELFGPCYEALRAWHFSPVMENGHPRPYRANIVFHTP